MKTKTGTRSVTRKRASLAVKEPLPVAKEPSGPVKKASPPAKKPPRAARKPSPPTETPSPAVTEPAPPAMEASSPLEAWREAAMQLPAAVGRPRVPLHVLLDEAVAVAQFFEKYFATVRNEDGTVARVGLDSVARPGRDLTAATGAEILSLREAIHEVQAKYVAVAAAPREGPPLTRARFLLTEIRSALGFLFDDGVRDAKDVQLAKIGATKVTRGQSAWAIRTRLLHYAMLAGENRQALDGLGGFDVALIDEAMALAEGMVTPSGPAIPLSELPSGVLELRQRLARLLADRMTTVRGAARFVFRRSPAIIREATSPYERRRAVTARQARAAKRGEAPRKVGRPRKIKSPAPAGGG